MVRTKQGGSILSFVVIGITLAALLVGGVWAVRHIDFGAMTSSEATEVAQAPADEDVKNDEGDSKKDDAAKSDKDEKGTEREAVTTPADDRTADKPVTTPETKSEKEQHDSVAGTQPGDDKDVSVTEMPQTGPEGLLSGVSVAVLVGALAAYAASRRYVAGL